MKFDPDINAERLEILDGSRGKPTDQAAVRIEDLGAILELSQQPMKSVPVTGDPTAAEYNALRSDVEKVNACLLAVAQALQARLI